MGKKKRKDEIETDLVNKKETQHPICVAPFLRWLNDTRLDN